MASKEYRIRYRQSTLGKIANKRAEKRSRKLKREYIASIKMQRGCLICGYKRCAYALYFHHIEEKLYEMSSAQILPWNKMAAEMKKCIVVCANCHYEIHSGLHPQYIQMGGDKPVELPPIHYSGHQREKGSDRVISSVGREMTCGRGIRPFCQEPLWVDVGGCSWSAARNRLPVPFVGLVLTYG